MRNELKTFSYHDFPIEFQVINGHIMANATQMFEANNSRLDNWLNSNQTKKYFNALLKLLKKSDPLNLGIAENQLIISKKGGVGAQGTWIHERLILNAARYISVDFELWCDEKLAELIRTGKTELSPDSPQLQIANAVILAQKLLAEHSQIIEEQKAQLSLMAPKAEYTEKVLTSRTSWTSTTIAKSLGLKSAQQLHKRLNAMGIIFKDSDGIWVPYSKYADKNLTETRTSTYTDSHGKVCTSITTVWTERGRNFIHERLNQKLLLA